MSTQKTGRPAAVAIGLAALLATSPSSADVVLDWNATALRTTAAVAFNPPFESRSLAIVHAAVFDAVNAVTGEFEPYAVRKKPAPGASPEAAAAAAAHRALARLYPARQAELDAALAQSLAALPDDVARAEGVALGLGVADELLALRASDGADAATRARYAPGGGAGLWTPTPPAHGPALDPGWGAVRPFALKAGSQFRPASPPGLASAEYARDFNEVKELGAAASGRRTPAQTALARLWIATGPQVWNPVVRQVSAARGLTLSQNARAFALLNLAGADAFIAAWDSKYAANQWRPVTAIRAAQTDGNPETTADPSWTPLLDTPPFPDYIAGHTTYGGAAERVLERLFGRRPGATLELRSATAPGVVQTYATFEHISRDVVDARVWGGIHWRTSSVRGRSVGQLVGDYACDHVLRPVDPRPIPVPRRR